MTATTLPDASPRTFGSRRARQRSRASELGWAALRWVTIALALVITIVPFFWLVTTSFKQQID
jgi:ABC-type glycerol-3-phosphate transport system permease component